MLIRLSRLTHDGRRKKCCFKGTLKSFRGVLGGGGLYAEAIRNVKGNLTIFEVARLFVQHYTLLACQSKGQLVSGQNYLYNDRKNKTVSGLLSLHLLKDSIKERSTVKTLKMNTDQQKVNEIFQSSKEKLQGDAKVVNDAFKEMASKDKNGKADNISDNTRKPDYQEQYNKLKGAGHRNE
ncbi:hypothetical protein SKDZ_13G3000 [Saccharomyces kudriavzevii ZP591]|nr:hypothetical protein SKDZ_13G3000 [Saccharomyces kudriavzevii ZP591]